MSVNKVIIVGRLGNDPEVRQFQNGGSVTHISVATSERWTDKNTGERKEQTEWHRISLFNRLGEIAAQYLRKGSMVYVEGSLHTRKYTDQQGIERYATEIRASEMRMLGGGNNDNSYGGGYQGNYQNNNYQNNGGYNRQAQQGGYQNNYPNNNYQNNRQNFNQPQTTPMQSASDYGDMNQDYEYDAPPPASRPTQPTTPRATSQNSGGQSNNFGSPSASSSNANPSNAGAISNNAPKPMTGEAGQMNDDDMPF